MSNLSIRQGLEKTLKALSPNFPTAWENKSFIPEAGTAYQEVYFLFAEPDNPTMGDNHYRQRGVMQLTLRYPLDTGPRDAAERAEVLRQAFHRGLSVVTNAVTTIVDRTPEITGGQVIDDRYVIIVRVRFYADLF